MLASWHVRWHGQWVQMQVYARIHGQQMSNKWVPIVRSITGISTTNDIPITLCNIEYLKCLYSCFNPPFMDSITICSYYRWKKARFSWKNHLLRSIMDYFVTELKIPLPKPTFDRSPVRQSSHVSDFRDTRNHTAIRAASIFREKYNPLSFVNISCIIWMDIWANKHKPSRVSSCQGGWLLEFYLDSNFEISFAAPNAPSLLTFAVVTLHINKMDRPTCKYYAYRFRTEVGIDSCNMMDEVHRFCCSELMLTDPVTHPGRTGASPTNASPTAATCVTVVNKCLDDSNVFIGPFRDAVCPFRRLSAPSFHFIVPC